MAQDHIFNSILVQRPGRNTFDLSHSVNTSFNMGWLTPLPAVPVLPGDSMRIGIQTLLRFAPLIAPVMSKVNVEAFVFFCPDRILFANQQDWEDWITDPENTTVEFPWVGTIGGSQEGKLLDYLYGLESLPSGQDLNVAPIAAYTKIWDEWFRNQNITTTERHIPVTLNAQETGYRTILQSTPYLRTWEKDYFTASLPWPQRGSQVTLPLLEAGTALVELSGTNEAGQMLNATTGLPFSPGAATSVDIGTDSATEISGTDGFYDPGDTLQVDINTAAATINALREAFRMQEYLELDAMAGNRYNEKIYAHFGVKIPDARISRPELLGRWKGRMAITEVPQTSAAPLDTTQGSGTPLGTLGGHGISVLGGEDINFYSYEHGWLICLINVQPDAVYGQGINKHYQKLYPLDLYWPKLAHIGEQEVLNKEIYHDHSALEGTHGYVPRYAEYRFQHSTIAGEMRTTLAHWHLGRIFSGDTALNEAFVYCNPSARIFNELYDGNDPNYTGDQIFGHVYWNILASRLIPKYGRPSL